jgi:hypothetical protein
MVKRLDKYLFLLTFLIFQNSLSYAQENWKLVKDSNGIKVFTKNSKNFDFKIFRANMLLDNSIHAFIAVLNDVEGLTNWGYKIKHVSLLERSGDTLQKYYSIAEAPFPYKNRDGVYLNRFKWISDTHTLFVEIEILDDYLDLNDKFVRLNGKGFWRVIVLPSGKLDVTFQMQIDPGGSIPAWLSNIFVDDSPYFTMLKLKKIIKDTRYHEQKYNFIH